MCTVSDLYSGTRSSPIGWRSVQYTKYNNTKFITHENFQFIWFSKMCEILYRLNFLRIRYSITGTGGP